MLHSLQLKLVKYLNLFVLLCFFRIRQVAEKARAAVIELLKTETLFDPSKQTCTNNYSLHETFFHFLYLFVKF